MPAGKAVAAVAGWLELIARTAEKSDDILEILASVGPEAIQVLLILGSQWREGNGRFLHHLCRILSRQACRPFACTLLSNTSTAASK